jgi:hypothetical protein
MKPGGPKKEEMILTGRSDDESAVHDRKRYSRQRSRPDVDGDLAVASSPDSEAAISILQQRRGFLWWFFAFIHRGF